MVRTSTQKIERSGQPESITPDATLVIAVGDRERLVLKWRCASGEERQNDSDDGEREVGKKKLFGRK